MMKKILNWMLAAILICGSSVVLTSCGNDDDDKGGGTTPDTYDVTLSAVLPECTAGLFSLNVAYTDANGKSITATVKAGDTSDEMIAEMKADYEQTKKDVILMLNWNEERAKLFDKLIVKNFKLTVPAGKSFSYTVTMNGRTDYVTPSGDEFCLVKPFVCVYAKRITGGPALKGEMSLRGWGPIATADVAELISTSDDTEIANEVVTMK